MAELGGARVGPPSAADQVVLASPPNIAVLAVVAEDSSSPSPPWTVSARRPGRRRVVGELAVDRVIAAQRKCREGLGRGRVDVLDDDSADDHVGGCGARTYCSRSPARIRLGRAVRRRRVFSGRKIDGVVTCDHVVARRCPGRVIAVGLAAALRARPVRSAVRSGAAVRGRRCDWPSPKRLRPRRRHPRGSRRPRCRVSSRRRPP